MGVNDKLRTDLDIHKGSNLGMGCTLLKYFMSQILSFFEILSKGFYFTP